MQKTIVKNLLLLTLLVIAATATAQHDASHIIGERSSNLIDSTMNGLNMRATIFNEELGKINKLNPLDAASFVPEKLQSNMSDIRDFLAYLDLYRASSAKNLQVVRDSVDQIRRDVPKSKRKTYLKEFISAYELDHNAFEKYTLALSAVYTNVVTALEYASSLTLEVKDDKLQFSSKEEYTKYNKLIDAVHKSNTKLITAGNKSQKATADASAAMQRVYSDIPR